jgi:hypothetical protein
MPFDPGKFNSVDADGGFAPSEMPPPGQYTVSINDAKARTLGKDNPRDMLVVEYKDADGRQWADIKTFETDGQIKSAKILLRQLGLGQEYKDLADMDMAVSGLIGEYFYVEIVVSSTINRATGEPYKNTQIIGKAVGHESFSGAAASEEFARSAPAAVPSEPAPWD